MTGPYFVQILAVLGLMASIAFVERSAEANDGVDRVSEDTAKPSVNATTDPQSDISDHRAPAGYLSPSTHSPTVEGAYLGPDFSRDIARLERKGRRQFASAIGVYAYSILPLGVGISSLVNGHCHPDRYLCEGAPGANGFLSGESALGVTMLTFSAASSLGIGLPLHRAANRNRQLAEAMQLDQIQSYNRHLIRGEALRRSGRNLFIASGVIGAGAIGSLLSIPFYQTDQQLTSRALIFGGLSAAGLVTVLSAHGTTSRGKALLRRGELSRPADWGAAPVFQSGGAGVQLWAGF